MKAHTLGYTFVSILLQIGFSYTVQSQNLDWVKMFGGDYLDRSNAIELDKAGNVYTTGIFSTTVDFDPGPGVFELTKQGGYFDCYVSKLTSEGEFVWAISFAAEGNCEGYEIEIDVEGNLYIVGDFLGRVDFDPGPDTFELYTSNPNAGFIVKLSGDGDFIWAKQLDFGALFNVSTLDSDKEGNIYFSGLFADSIDLDPGPETHILSNPGNVQDFYLCKWTGEGQFIWGKHYYSSGDQNKQTVFLSSGFIYFSGSFTGVLQIPDEPGVQRYSNGHYDLFISKLTLDGHLEWIKTAGGEGEDVCNTLTADTLGHVYIGGYFQSTVDFDPTNLETELTAVNGSDVFVAKFDDFGDLIWVRQFQGDSEFKSAQSMIKGEYNNLIVSGKFRNFLDVDPSSNQHMLNADTSNRSFIVSLSEDGHFQWAFNTGGWNTPIMSSGERLALDSLGNLYYTDYFLGTVDFDPGPENYYLTGPWYEVYVLKVTPPRRYSEISKISGQSANLYPNPTSGIVHVDSEMIINQVTIIDKLGRTVYDCVPTSNRIELSELVEGVYSALIRTEEGFFTKQIHIIH